MKRKPRLSHALQRIGARLGDLRKQMGYKSMKDFTRKHKLPLIQYWRIEKGKANLTIKSLVKLLSIHGLTIEDFFCFMKKL